MRVQSCDFVPFFHMISRLGWGVMSGEGGLLFMPALRVLLTGKNCVGYKDREC